MNLQKEEPAPWTIWRDEEQPDINGTGRRFRLKCSVCLRDLDVAVVFPEHVLRLCFSCLSKIHEQAINQVPSDGEAVTGPASDSASRPSRDDSPKSRKGQKRKEGEE
jgi:hypothetical protein